LKALTIEGIYKNGLVEILDTVDFKGSMRVLVVFIEEIKPKVEPGNKFSFTKSLELTKNCKGKLSDLIINERHSEKR
jgi:hypothetical protein